MASTDNFRSSLHGFNRTDVVQFIQQQTASHDKAMRTLKDENNRLLEALAEARAELERAKAEKESLLLELEVARLAVIVEQEEAPVAEPVPTPAVEAEAPIPAPVSVVPTAADMSAPKATDFNEMELAAYRRAEMTERMARERAAASAERMKAIFAQTDEKLSVSASDVATVFEAFKNDYEQLQQLLAEIQGIVDESSSGLKAMADLCSEV